MKTIELSEQEIHNAIQLFDAAVKAHGLQAAGAALHLVEKLNSAQEAEQPDE